MENSNKYEISTLRDVFEKVPADRISTCLNELGILMRQARRIQEIMLLVDEEMTGDKPKKAIEWPDVCTWIDDGCGELIARYTGPWQKEPIIITKTVLK